MFSSERILLLSIAFIFLIATFSCNIKQQQMLFQNNNEMKSLPSNSVSAVQYLIGPQDLLQIRNLQNSKYIVNEKPDIKNETSGNQEGHIALVEEDSTIALPLLGRIKVAGLTRREAARQIELLYRKELKNPIIELKIINLKITLLGEIKNQGVYNLTKDYTSLIEVIGAAGGLTDKANSKNIKIIRGNLQSPQVFELDLSKLSTLSDSRLMLQNNDVIYIAQHKKAIRSQQVQSMSAVLQPIIALLNTALIIYTLTK